ncbi:MAG: O-methyltransferase [Bacteroidota bacterium]|nr:O-methyltransferase [Bacteroidota bacterium]
MNIEEYSKHLSEQEDQILSQLRRETYIKVLMPRMISGHYQGLLLKFISKMINPTNILELGTYTGYSTICLAQGLRENGSITTIEKNDELKSISQKYFKLTKISDKVTQLFGKALKIIPNLSDNYDLVFIDADKREYLEYYIQVFNKIKKGGFIIVDNVFWNEKVIEPLDEKDEYTKGILEFNEYIKNDSRIEKITLNLRDGLMILRKK